MCANSHVYKCGSQRLLFLFYGYCFIAPFSHFWVCVYVCVCWGQRRALCVLLYHSDLFLWGRFLLNLWLTFFLMGWPLAGPSNPLAFGPFSTWDHNSFYVGGGGPHYCIANFPKKLALLYYFLKQVLLLNLELEFPIAWVDIESQGSCRLCPPSTELVTTAPDFT